MPARVTSRDTGTYHRTERQQLQRNSPATDAQVIDLRTRATAADSPDGARGPEFESRLLFVLDLLALTAVALVSVAALGIGGLAAPLLAGVLLMVTAGRRSAVTVSAVSDLPRLAAVVGLATLLTLALQGSLSTGTLDWRDVVLQGLLLLAALVVAHTAGAAAVRRLRIARRVSHRTIVVGSGSEAADVADRLQDHPELGFHLIGLVRDQVSGRLIDQPWLGTVGELARVVDEAGAHRLVIAGTDLAADHGLLDAVRSSTCHNVWLASSKGGLAPAGSKDIGGMWLMRVRVARRHAVAMALKRALDVAIAGLALLLLSPLLLSIALAVRLIDGAGVFFAQQRIGLGGQPFMLYKFRSVRDSATDAADGSGDDAGAVWSIDGDSRVTPLGAVLRRTCIDELPQLWNILRGDMSLVGPRPERPSFAEEFAGSIPHYRWRHRVPAGLTGLAQVNGLRGDTSIAERARLDNLYIEDWSPQLELSIILRTFAAIARPSHGTADKA